MKKNSIFKKVWDIVFPVIIYFSISVITAFVAMIGMTVKIVMEKNEIYDSSASDNLELVEEVMSSYTNNVLILTLISALISLPVLYYLYKSDFKKLFANEKYKVIPYVNYVYVAIVAIFGSITFNTLISFSNLINFFPGYNEVAEFLYDESLLVQILGVAIVIPIVEELIFRGLIFKRMSTYAKTSTAVIISSLIFAVYHFNVVQGIYAFLVGIIFAIVYDRYNNLLAPCLAHIAANGTSVFLSETGLYESIYSSVIMAILFTILSVVIFVYSFRWILKNVKKERINIEFVEEIKQFNE